MEGRNLGPARDDLAARYPTTSSSPPPSKIWTGARDVDGTLRKLAEDAYDLYGIFRFIFRYFAAFVGLTAIGVTQAAYGWAGQSLAMRTLYPAACFVMALACLSFSVIVARAFYRGEYKKTDE